MRGNIELISPDVKLEMDDNIVKLLVKFPYSF